MRKPAIIVLIVLLIQANASAVKIADITRLSGERSNILTGMGLVFGLKGTGDGGNYLPAIRPLASMMQKFNNTATVVELTNAANVALVSITATIPPSGVRNGDRIDLYVTSIGAAASLRGGRLFVSPMQGPIPGNSGILALAEGAISLEDPSVPTGGIVRRGAVMEADLMPKSVVDGHFTLILDDPEAATWVNASTIAKIINDAENTAGETLAVAVDAKNVVVTIPPGERQAPDSFISRVQRLPVPILPTKAKVVINEKKKTIVITGDVEISPVVISQAGLTISTVKPEPIPTVHAPIVINKDVVALDTTNQGGAKLQDLVAALDQLKVPTEDRITIIQELHKSGKLHAELVME